jgi:hypothetical protein
MAKRTTRREGPQRPPAEVVRQGTSDERTQAAVMDNEPEPHDRQPDPDAIARRAYEIYCERGHEPGRAMDHWLQAEQELRRSV